MRVLGLISAAILAASCFYALASIWRRKASGWDVGTSMGLVLLNAWGLGLIAVASGPIAALIVVGQVTASYLLLRNRPTASDADAA